MVPPRGDADLQDSRPAAEEGGEGHREEARQGPSSRGRNLRPRQDTQ